MKKDHYESIQRIYQSGRSNTSGGVQADKNSPKEIIIAVTGHRDLADSDKVRDELKKEFQLIKERSGGCKIVLLTALAKGADQLALEVFHEVFDEELKLTQPNWLIGKCKLLSEKAKLFWIRLKKDIFCKLRSLIINDLKHINVPFLDFLRRKLLKIDELFGKKSGLDENQSKIVTAQIQAVLPMALEQYKETFDDDNDRGTFERIWSQLYPSPPFFRKMVDVLCVALIAKIHGSAGASPSNRNNASFPKVDGEAPAEPTFSGTLFSKNVATQGIVDEDILNKPSSAQIQELKKTIDRLPAEEETLLGQIKSLSAQIAELPDESEEAKSKKTDLDLIKKRLAELQKQLQTAKQSKKSLENECFASLSDYYAKHADIVIAIWDGVWNGKTGGTSDIVEKLRRRGAPKQRCRIIRWLATPRESNPYPANESMTWTHMSVDCSPKAFDKASSTFRPWFRTRWKTIFLAIFFLTALGTGICGYLNLDSHPWDSFHSAVAHLGFNGFGTAELVEKFPEQPQPLQPNAASRRLLTTEEETSVWLLRISQTAATLFILLSAGVVMEAAFKIFSGIKLWWRSLRPHDLIIGLGRTGQSILQDSSRGSRPVVAVETQPDSAVERLCQSLGVSLITVDASDPSILQTLGLGKVKKAYICTGRDETNMRIVNRIAHLRSRKPSLWYRFSSSIISVLMKLWTKSEKTDEVLCAVGISHRENLETLRNCLPSGHNLDLRIFNREECTARAFLANHHLDRFTAAPDATVALVILIGDSPLADAFVRQILQLGIFEHGKSLEVIRLCDNAETACRAFVAQYPCFSPEEQINRVWTASPEKVWHEEGVLPIVHFHHLPESDLGKIQWFEEHLKEDEQKKDNQQKAVTTVLVAYATSSVSASITSLIIPTLEQACTGREAEKTIRTKDITIWSYFDTADSVLSEDLEQTLNKNSPALPVRIITNFLGRCTRKTADGSELDYLAYRINGQYSEVKDLDDYEVLSAKWKECSENDKDSNRQAAAHALVKSRILTRLRRAGSSNTDIIDELARCEHRRWCAEYLLKGFRPLTRIPSEIDNFKPTKNELEMIRSWFGDKSVKASYKATKRHIDLIPYDDLAKLLGEERGTKEQKKDKDQIQLLEDLLSWKVTA